MDDNVTAKFFYKKKAGTSAISGQLYETKFLSLLLFRTLKDESINEFYLGSNIEIDGFDDVCIKWKRDGKDTVVFVQLKHKENKTKSADFNLVTYFESYKKLKNSFNVNNKDILFKSDIANTDFYLVFYTVSNNIISKEYINKDYSPLPWLEKLICTGGKGNIFQISDIDYLMKLQTDVVIDLLGEALAENLVKNTEKNNYAIMLTKEYCNGLFKRYHVVLAEKVINVSDVVVETIKKDKKNEKNENIEKFRNGNFRQEFLNCIDDTFLGRLRENIKKKLGDEYWKEVESKSFVFKLPHCFGNIDLTVRNHKRICALAEFIISLFNTYSEIKIITLNMDSCKELQEGFLGLNGGLESLVGNLLISDDKTQMLKFNDNLELKHVNAKKLLVELKKNAEKDGIDLFSYKFDIQLTNFTTLYLVGDKHERELAKEYLDSLWLFTDQAKEKEVGDTLMREIEVKGNNENKNPLYPTFHSYAKFLKFHDTVQKWWMQLNRVEYLDHTCKFYEQSITNIVDMLATLHDMYVSKIINSYIEFKHDATLDLSFDENNKIIIIYTRNILLTNIKIHQCCQNSNGVDIIFIDIEDIIKKKCYDIMLNELKKSKYNMIVLMHEIGGHLCLLENAIETALKNSKIKTILIVSESELELRNGINYGTSHDEYINLIDIQNYNEVLKKHSVLFQMRETTLDRLIDDRSKHLIQADILTKLLNNETIEIGKSTVSSKYLEIKDYLVQRTMTQGEKNYHVRTFDDIQDNVVLVVGDSGMGKSILLNHITEQTKDSEDNNLRKSKWIVNITLLDYCHEFNKWKKNKVNIDKSEALSFLCRIAVKCLSYTFSKDNKRGKNEFRIFMDGDKPKITGFDGDCIGFLEIQLFLNHFNEGNVIILFDGFDEVCPKYEAEVIRLINILNIQLHEQGCVIPIIDSRSKHIDSLKSRICNCDFLERAIRLWITCRSYTSIINVLVSSLGEKVFELQNFTIDEQRNYVHKYFDKNLDLIENSTNIEVFVKYMLRINNYRDFAVWRKFRRNALYWFGMDYLRPNENVVRFWRKFPIKTTVFSVPLMLDIAVQVFLYQLTNRSYQQKWDDDDINTLYDHFLEVKFENVYFAEKKKIDVTIPGNEVYLINDRKCFHEKNKRIGFNTLFDMHVLHDLFPHIVTAEEVNKITDAINDSSITDDKCGIIENVLNGIPRFIHISFAEYYAAQYVFDLTQASIRYCLNLVEVHNELNNRDEELTEFFKCVMLLGSKDFKRILKRKIKYEPHFHCAIDRILNSSPSCSQYLLYFKDFDT